jgi:hypothetical protein
MTNKLITAVAMAGVVAVAVALTMATPMATSMATTMATAIAAAAAAKYTNLYVMQLSYAPLYVHGAHAATFRVKNST